LSFVRYATIAFCLTVLLLIGCNRATPQEKAAQDARDVAWVEAAQKVHPPIQPLDPQTLSPAVRRLYKLTANGCEFQSVPPSGFDPIFVAGQAKAILRVQDEPIVFAADTGSAKLAAGVHRKYAARAFWAELSDEPGSLTIHDRWDRVVYAAAGTLTCHG
jgi:hypothetical protein